MFTRSKQRAMEAIANEMSKQAKEQDLSPYFDNLGDMESIMLSDHQGMALNLAEIADALLAALEIEVEWENDE
jgi:uncharacterized lipoprotein